MIDSQRWQTAVVKGATQRRLGTIGQLYLFAWCLAAIFLTPAARLWIAGLLCVLLAVLLYPESLKRLLQPSWLLLVGLMVIPFLFLPGEPRVILGPFTLSDNGLQAIEHVALRAGVILLAVDGYTSSVSIGEMAGVFERVGLRGVGFAMGVALNMLPILRHSTAVTWHSLRMRGGLRRRPLRSMRYFLVTVSANAVRRAEEIALAAEARAYSPDSGRPVPLVHGSSDWPVVAFTLLALLVLRFL